MKNRKILFFLLSALFCNNAHSVGGFLRVLGKKMRVLHTTSEEKRVRKGSREQEREEERARQERLRQAVEWARQDPLVAERIEKRKEEERVRQERKREEFEQRAERLEQRAEREREDRFVAQLIQSSMRFGKIAREDDGREGETLSMKFEKMTQEQRQEIWLRTLEDKRNRLQAYLNVSLEIGDDRSINRLRQQLGAVNNEIIHICRMGLEENPQELEKEEILTERVVRFPHEDPQN